MSSTPPSSASLTSSVLQSTVAASLSGFVVSLPHLSPRLSLLHVMGCGGVGAVASVAQLGLAWLSEKTRTVPSDQSKESATQRAALVQVVADKREESG